MKISHKIILSSVAVVAAVCIGYLGLSNIQKGEKIRLQANKLTALQEQLSLQGKLYEADSLLVLGNYQKALKSYESTDFGTIEDGTVAVNLRKAIAKRFLDVEYQWSQKEKLQKDLQDSIANTIEELPDNDQANQLDSLSFALSKTKVQLAKLKRQLYQKSFGEYLTFTNSKGSQVHYVGKVKDGKANGYGVAILNTGSRYVGEWKNNQRHGQGAFYWKDGQYYEGNYSFGRRHGQGTYHWPNGEKYVGQWQDDQRSGKGAFYSKDGTLMTSGVWKNDQLVVSRDRPKKQKGSKSKDVAAL
ncbi:MAG: MORN repeat-containing protein [Croceivirga sp.]